VNLPEIYRNVNGELDKGLVNSRILLDRLRVADEIYRKSSLYQDPRYIPFYYHLGKFITPQGLFQIGLGLGFPICSLLQSCKTLKRIFTFQPKSDGFFSARLALSNIRDFHRGDLGYSYGGIGDEEFVTNFETGNWDLAFINVETSLDLYRDYLDLIWQQLPLDGIIVMDYLSSYQESNEAFTTFCKIVNREPVIFKTRFGTGIIQK